MLCLLAADESIMRWNRTTFALPLTLTLLALPLRLYDLAGKPLWIDEVLTHNRAAMPLKELVVDTLINKHFPTYFLLARLFDAPAIDEFTLRLPSVIFGCIAVLLVALIATEACSPRAGFMAGALTAASPFDVAFSQEARPYMMLSCLVLIALWGLLRIAGGSSSAASPPPAKSARIGWSAYGLGTVGALYVLTAAVFWWLASNLAVLALRIGRRTRTPVSLRPWLLAQAIIFAAWLPGLLALAIAARGDALNGYRWIPAATWHHVSTVLAAAYLLRASDVTSFALLPAAVPGLGLIVAALALFGAWHLRKRPERLAIIGVAFAAMPVGIALLSPIHSFWVPRYLLWSTGPLFALTGIGVAALPARSYWLVAAALIVAGIVNLGPYYGTETKPRWDLVAAYLAAHARPDDNILVNDAPAETMLEAYGDRYHLDLPIVDGYQVEHAAAHLNATGRVWVVFGRTGQGVSQPMESYLRKWSKLGTPADTLHFGRSIVAVRFDRD
jgi:mannosyltransferase